MPAERVGRNPQTKETITIPASKTPRVQGRQGPEGRHRRVIHFQIKAEAGLCPASFSSAWEKGVCQRFCGRPNPLKSPEINPVDFKVCFFGSGSGCGGSAAGSPLARSYGNGKRPADHSAGLSSSTPRHHFTARGIMILTTANSP